MGYYLLDHKPARSQYRSARRQKPTGLIVVHTAESQPDEVGPDTGAENVADFIRRRTSPGSYHALADSDSRVYMVPWSYEAFHDGTGSNPYSVGISAATQAARWPELSAEWRDATVTNLAVLAAEAALWLQSTYGIVVPARRVTRSVSSAGHAGFISHGERDPGRRSDPGKDFPWGHFLERFHYFTAMNGLKTGGSVPAPAVAEAPPWWGRLGPGQFLSSGNGRFTLTFQTDGNVVLYDHGSGKGVPIWASRTDGKAADALVLQDDGNLVLYNQGRGVWSTRTEGNPKSVLRVQNDGNVVLYGPGNVSLWSTKTSR